MHNPTHDNSRISHAEMVGPTDVSKRANELRMKDEFVRTLYVASWPPQFKAGILDELHTAPGADIEIAIHQDPIPVDQSISNYEDAIRDLKGALKNQEDRGSARAQETRKRLKEHEDTLDELRNGETRIHEVAVYVSLRAPSLEELNSLENDVRKQLTPAQVKFNRVARAHDKGVTSSSPVAKDVLHKTIRLKSGALAALYPFSSSTMIEPDGSLWGFHAVTEAPLMVDRFNRGNGYNMMVSGKTGDGKSFGAKLIMLRERIRDPDTIFVVVDPLSDFVRWVQQLDGEDISIGGTKGLNPMEIKPTPGHVLERKSDLNPYGKKVDGVLAFLDDFFEKRGVSFDHDVTIREMAVSHAYERAGITSDPATHHFDSPTIATVDPEEDDYEGPAETRPSLRGVLSDIQNNPEEYADNESSEDELDKFAEAARNIRLELYPFAKGQPYAHLGGTSDIHIDDDSSVINIDMQQAEQRDERSLMMQEILDTVYELSKETEKKVVLCIDEAHILLKNEHSLDWLDRVCRHSRHHDLSLMLLTQKISDFLSSEERQTILGNCSMQLHWREDKLSDEDADRLGLNSSETKFIRKAHEGDWDRGYAHALAIVDGDETFPIKVEALKSEARLIDEDLAKELAPA